jgi:hypothetical protein
MMSPANVTDFQVELPAGGVLHLQTADEVELWNKAMAKYKSDYVLIKHNDLINLGLLLQQQVVSYRAQLAINGMEPQVDAQGVPTGAYRRIELDPSDVAIFQKTLTEVSKEIGRLEKALNIDKSTREAGGQHTLDNYVKNLKLAAHRRGIHVVDMVLEYQKVWKELTWRLRLLYHADAQDRAYHGITPRSVLDWLYGEMQRLEAKDQEWARDVGKLYAGQL